MACDIYFFMVKLDYLLVYTVYVCIRRHVSLASALLFLLRLGQRASRALNEKCPLHKLQDLVNKTRRC